MGHLLCFMTCFLLGFLITSSLPSESTAQFCSHNDGSALIQFNNSLTVNEFGSLCGTTSSYPKTSSWKEGRDCCSWEGVTCHNVTGRVIGLDLSCSSLFGIIHSNSTLFHLQHLQTLNLAFNDFFGSNISDAFGSLTGLVHLNLSGSEFSGEVPRQLSHLSKLVSLDLSRNYNPTLEEHVWEGIVGNMSEVRELFLDYVNMSSVDIGSLTNLSSSLTALSVSNCDLRGDFPSTIFRLPQLRLLTLGWNTHLNVSLPKSNWTNPLRYLDLSPITLSTEFVNSMITKLETLEHLNLGGCGLTGSIPSSIANLSRLVHLDLSENSFTLIPFSITNLTRLEYLDIHSNQLEGSIPDKVAAFPNLIHLDLAYNSLEGNIPSCLFDIPSLRVLRLFGNQLTGRIHEFHHKSLMYLSLEDNNLHGPVPSSVFDLVNLTLLDLSSNNLSGTLELGMFSKLQSLRGLHLAYNSLSLDSKFSANYTLPKLLYVSLSSCNITEFPSFLLKLPNLQGLDLSYNNLSSFSPSYRFPNLQVLFLSSCNLAVFPILLKGLSGLRYLELASNRIYGQVPEWMWDVGKNSLSSLNLSHNSLTGFERLPWKNIQFLDLSYNLIEGDVFEITPWICNLNYVLIIDLSHNNMSGTIPQCVGNLSTSLSGLNLGTNNFRGTIPWSLAEGCKLLSLNLNGNQLEGPLPESIINCRDLQVLDLGHNKFNGTFPRWLATLSELQVLVLRSNQFHGSLHGDGTIQPNNNSFSKLRIFDISSNELVGPLPTMYINCFQAMMLHSQVAHYVGSYWNSFYGFSIRMTLKGSLIELEKVFGSLAVIDLSSNKFEGEIPVVMGKLKSLIGLNLSHNNLVGHIPLSLGNLTNLEWLDLASNALAGEIPTQLVDLKFLSLLNLSSNRLVGPIPQGKQFNTFENSSYQGNDGLCGFPLSIYCKGNNKKEPLQGPTSYQDEIGFGWKQVVIGYGCGFILGLALGYAVFQTGKPKWFVALVEGRRRPSPRRSNRDA